MWCGIKFGCMREGDWSGGFGEIFGEGWTRVLL